MQFRTVEDDRASYMLKLAEDNGAGETGLRWPRALVVVRSTNIGGDIQ